MGVPVRFQRPTPTDMHPGVQGRELRIGHQLRMGGRSQCLCFVVGIRRHAASFGAAEDDGIGM